MSPAGASPCTGPGTVPVNRLNRFHLHLLVLEHRLQLNGVIIRGNSSNISLQDAFVTIFD
jgi:hypothetical protein